MSTFTRKGYGRIYCLNAADAEKVATIIKELDEFEYEYLPKDLIAPFSEYPKLKYTHKFDALDLNMLTAVCWQRSIVIWCCDNGNEEYMTDETKGVK